MLGAGRRRGARWSSMDSIDPIPEEAPASDAPRGDARAGRAGRNLTEGPITRTLLLFSLPILASNALQSLNGTVNQFWVSHTLGETAVAALGNANLVMYLLIGSIFGVSLVANILIAQSVGGERFERVKAVMGSAITFFLALSIVMGAFGVFVAPSILTLMQTPAEVHAQASIYLRIIFAATPFLYFFAFLQMAQQGAGDSRTPLYFMGLAVLISVALNPILIRGFGPIPPLGIAGSAAAGLISQGVSLFLLVVVLYRRGSVLMLRRSELGHLKPNFEIIGVLVRRGLPMGLQMLIMSGGALIMMGFVNRYGALTAAAFAIASVVWSYVQMPAMAIGASISSMAAQNVGAARWDRVAAVARSGVICGLVVTGLLCALLYVLNEPVLGLLLPAGSPVLGTAAHINVVVLWSFAVFSITFALGGVVRSTGAVWGPMAILIIATVVVRLPFAAVLMPYWGKDAIWWSFPVGAVLSSLLTGLYYLYGPWRRARLLRDEPTGEVSDTGLAPPTIDPPEADKVAAVVMAEARKPERGVIAADR